MSTPFVNFLQAPQFDWNQRQARDFSDILKGYEKGYRLGEMPGEMKRKREKEELLNKIKAAEAEHAPEYYKERAKSGGINNLYNAILAQHLQQYGGREKEANIALTQAQTGKASRTDLDDVKEAQEAYKSAKEEFGENDERTKNLKNYAIRVSQGGGYGMTQAQRVWNSLPADEKRDELATGRAWGVDPVDYANMRSSGLTMDEIRNVQKDLGYDTSQQGKVYVPTTSNITQQKNMEGALSELDVLEKRASEAMAPFAQTVAGYSPKEIISALKGENKEARIKFLASRALQPEIAGARTRIAGGSNAHGALKDMQEKSLGNIKIFKPFVTSEEFEGMQKELNNILKEAFEARKKTIYNIKDKNTTQEFSQILNDQSGKVSDEELMKIIGGT